ncbi:nucleotidyltransferase family protein [Marinilabilia salmonicolor]|uniref:nucleotidyltransferase family protein n=1 Tax=Marinilabilia salmonicolor TaxID=989 RepID=UPI0021620B6F|nr:nucleotidyltransferase domain-containing protein [Marinilabilia salmonicolor]
MGVFGSVARGEHRKQSDIDIYYGGEPLSLFKLSDLKDKLEQKLDTPVDLVRLRDSMNQFLKERIQKYDLNI